jgi:hypothetical protein
VAHGRKLDGMATHARSIIAQSGQMANPWFWANGQTSELSEALETHVTPIVDKWAPTVRASTLALLEKQKGGNAEACAWLDGFKEELDFATQKLERPLGVLVGMHTTRLKMSVERPSKKAKTATEEGDLRPQDSCRQR